MRLGLKLEKWCDKVIFTEKSGKSEEGRKKGYAMHVCWQDGKVVDYNVIKGFAYVRRDASQICKHIEKAVIDIALTEKMADKVKESIKASRLLELQSLQKEITLQKNRALEGKDVDVLVEGYGKREGQIMGRTGTNKVVNFIGDNSYMGKLINVKIKK